jgi:hypothetical protein
MPRPKGLPKTGGRKKGQGNKPRAITLPDTDESRALIALAPTAEIRTPKAVMLSAMMKFERMSDVLMAKAERMTGDKFPYEDIKQVVAEAHKFTFAAVKCASEAAPYVHAKLLSIESRAEEKAAPFVVRAPAVMADSSAWQAAVGAAVIDMEAAQAPSAGRTEVSAHSAQQQGPEPQNAPPTTAVALMNDPKTNRITVMPPGPRVVQPVGSAEWLAGIQKKVG